jgi:hypothetical protein
VLSLDLLVERGRDLLLRGGIVRALEPGLAEIARDEQLVACHILCKLKGCAVDLASVLGFADGSSLPRLP